MDKTALAELDTAEPTGCGVGGINYPLRITGASIRRED